MRPGDQAIRPGAGHPTPTPVRAARWRSAVCSRDTPTAWRLGWLVTQSASWPEPVAVGEVGATRCVVGRHDIAVSLLPDPGARRPLTLFLSAASCAGLLHGATTREAAGRAATTPSVGVQRGGRL